MHSTSTTLTIDSNISGVDYLIDQDCILNNIKINNMLDIFIPNITVGDCIDCFNIYLEFTNHQTQEEESIYLSFEYNRKNKTLKHKNNNTEYQNQKTIDKEIKIEGLENSINYILNNWHKHFNEDLIRRMQKTKNI